MMETIRIYSQDRGMEFGIVKYIMLMKSGKRITVQIIEIPNEESMKISEITSMLEYWNWLSSNKRRRSTT